MFNLSEQLSSVFSYDKITFKQKEAHWHLEVLDSEAAGSNIMVICDLDAKSTVMSIRRLR
jgi:hypothetical protein